MRYFISTGEPSGELHASELMRAIIESDPEAEFVYLGGEKMEEVSGTKPLIDIREMSVMGFSQVIKKLPIIFSHLRKVKRMLKEKRPDAVILVDYPSFNLKIARMASKLGLPVFWYISPKVWVWKEHRVKMMKKTITRLYSILPFEPEYFASRHDWDVEYVGNPSVEEINRRIKEFQKVSKKEFKLCHGLPSDKPILALVPGSRVQEIKSNLPIMVDVARRFADYEPVVTAMKDLPVELYEQLAPGVPRLTGETLETLSHSDVALVTSGTATLETALVGIPQVMMYRHSGSRLMYKLGRRFLKVKYFSLPNLIDNEEVIPELVMHFCTPDAVHTKLSMLLNDESIREQQLKGYKSIKERLGERVASDTVANDIVEFIKKNYKKE
ncbi:MAG: lipid-A-disaccharide synthase [Muribaculaceae bacterium]|nr:lipid-A-disaccharide synthase [Muribaculaceae bacterium]